MPEDLEIIDYCRSCQAAMDVSALAPFDNVVCPTCGEQTRVKLQFGPYELIRRHAVGGMSMVFAAMDVTLHREVAVKILNRDYSKDETRIRAFEEEARITASFNHPHVVRVLRTGHAFGHFYIAMELISGGHFEQHIHERGKVPESEMLTLAIEIALGLKAAKAAGLIHRDIKPGNILLDCDGHVKIVDFGLALVTQEGKAKASEIWATPYYVPPETILGQEEDFRSDIYAFGSTLYHALAGSPPCNETVMATDRLIKAKQQIIPLHKIAPYLSEETCSIITKAMAYEPNGRFASYDELISQLQSALKHLKSGAAHLDLSSQNSRKHSKSIQFAAICASVLLLGTMGFFAWHLFKTKPQEITHVPAIDHSTAEESPELISVDIARPYREAHESMETQNYEKAILTLDELFSNPSVHEPSRSWIGIEMVVCHYLKGDSKSGRIQAKRLLAHLESLTGDHSPNFISIKATLHHLEGYPPIEVSTHSEVNQTGQLMAAILAGTKNWEQGLITPAAKCFKLALENAAPTPDHWTAIYSSIASEYLSDYEILKSPLFHQLPATRQDCENAIDELNAILPMLKTQGRARFNVRAWQLDIARHSRSLEKSES